MVFSSIPAYLDPANWQQQPSHHHQTGNNNHINHGNMPHQLHQQQLQHQTPPPGLLQPPPQPGSIRPGSMAERARMANIPMPEPSLKCPRCESSNTKFCYFNNYSLTQPRHFCKTCRRYWTRGGALRNVPVGGGCRRNKRSKSGGGGSSKSPATSSGGGDRASSSTSNNTASSNMNASQNHMPSLLGLTPPQIPPLRFLSPMSQLSDHFGGGAEIYGISAPPAVGTTSEMNMNNMNSFHVSPNMVGNGMGSLLSSGGNEPWRLQQHFPFLGGLDSGLYNNQEGFVGEQFRPPPLMPKFPGSGGSMAAPPVKMEGNPELSLSRQLMGMNGNGNINVNQHDHHQQQQWNININMNSGSSGAGNWTDLASFSSSSTTAPL